MSSGMTHDSVSHHALRPNLATIRKLFHFFPKTYGVHSPDRGLPRQMPDAQLHVADVWLGFKVFIKSGFLICSWGGPGWLLGGQLGAGNTPQDHSVYPT